MKGQSPQSFTSSADEYLTHYWPIENGEIKDVIDSKDMEQGNFTSFIGDRFGCPNSALALNGGWTQVPPGIYFDTPEFTISFWIYPQQVGVWSKVIDFGNGPNSNNIFLSQYSTPYFQIYSNNVIVNKAVSPDNLQTNKWQFLAVTLNCNRSTIYIDGQLTATSSHNYTLQILNRTKCFIGKSNWAEDGYSYSYLDDLRFYNKSLTQEEIVELMNYQNLTSRKIDFFIFFGKFKILEMRKNLLLYPLNFHKIRIPCKNRTLYAISLTYDT
jgi:hypothetical protein